MRHFRRLRRPRSSHRSFVLRPAGQAFAIEGSLISIYRLRRVTFWSIVRQRAKFVRDTVHRRMLFSIHRRSNLYRLCCHFGRWRAPAGPSRPGGVDCCAFSWYVPTAQTALAPQVALATLACGPDQLAVHSRGDDCAGGAGGAESFSVDGTAPRPSHGVCAANRA